MKLKYILPLIVILGILLIWISIESNREDKAPKIKQVEEIDIQASIENTEKNLVETNPKKILMIMNDSEFSPSSIEINAGDSIIFSNKGKNQRWPASNTHPTHEIYSEFDPKTPIAPGSSWEFQFNKSGTWRYHDHLSPGIRGVITVK